MSLSSEVFNPAASRRPSVEPDFKLIFNILPGYTAVLDTQWHVVAMNAAYLAAIGRHRFEVIGQRAPEALRIDAAARDRFETSLRGVFTDGHEDQFHVEGKWLQDDKHTTTGAYNVIHTAVPCCGKVLQFVIHHVVDMTTMAQQRVGQARDIPVAPHAPLPPRCAGAPARPICADKLRNRVATHIGVDRVRQILQAETASGACDIEVLAAEVTAQRRRAAFLASVSRRLADSLDYTTTLQRISRLALPTLADLCIIDVVDEHQHIKRVQVAHVSPSREAMAQEMKAFAPLWDNLQPSTQVLRQGRPWMAEVVTPQIIEQTDVSLECRAAIERLQLKTFLAVPMRLHGRTLGVICLGGTQPGRHFTQEDLACAEAMAERAAFALVSARLYRDAQAALASRDDFLMVAAHELRTPLTSLMLQIHTVHRRTMAALSGHAAQPALDARLQCLTKHSERIAHLIDAMLDVACIASGQFAVTLSPVNFVDVIHDVLRQLQASGDLARSHCEVQTQTPKKLIGQWDRARLEQLIHHLLANAIKYGAKQPVHIILHEKDKEVVLCVQDYGIGIDEQAQMRIFERFARAISTHNYGGLGVGLYVVRQIVEAMGGRITVDSRPGGGATFTVVLPRSRPCTPKDAPPPHLAFRTAPKS